MTSSPFRCGGDSRLVVTRSSVHDGEQQTKASWRVADIAAEVAVLRGRGVGIAMYDGRYPGHLGAQVFRPESASAGEYRIVYRFDTAEHLRAWLDSDEHAAWLERAEPHVIGPIHRQVLTGLETWFTVPGRQGTRPPPPYKMAVLTWITIFPLITLVVVVLGPLLDGLPLVARLAITTAVTVPIMTWLVMPRVTRLLRGWLYHDS
jgi:uncharacterized protein